MATLSVSVVVPTFRRPGSLAALVRGLEAQSLPPDRFEVVVVDNGSGDETLDVLARLQAGSPLQLRVLEYTTRQGPAGARNAGWRAAAAPIIAFTDDDCSPGERWLEEGLAVITADDRLGVVQGRTVPPTGAAEPPWSVVRRIDAPSPFFEGCNLFFRREALEVTGGFDEVAGFYFEDTAAGWAVVDAGWEAGFAEEALLVHPVEDRGFVWHIRNGFVERNLVRVAKAHPGFRATFWRPWAHQRDTVMLAGAAVGLLGGVRWRPALLLCAPYARYVLRRAWGLRRPAYLVERTVVDVARTAGHVVGSVENGVLIL